MLSGDTSLMNGNSEACAIVAANAVLPEPGGPAKRRRREYEKKVT